jgi:hypothetical protein
MENNEALTTLLKIIAFASILIGTSQIISWYRYAKLKERVSDLEEIVSSHHTDIYDYDDEQTSNNIETKNTYVEIDPDTGLPNT